ncbi:hypothetical protein N7509_012366 [Penicillium cosmopolitanum]|uniref:Uncharacterized protein n=1 Tax=Penicillium cosmopolitanum TaxID=1131564 RepID=A0A9W9SJB7_9EURO|nr:uncharacterized protein N7509_012366 [Penicillium cosmopolitanum]KAJ5379247.1 hypothetical protein N7509_012366 [Penicillium cosmopolitanum]
MSNSNTKRAQRRQECREVLADHIYNQLGLTVPPNRIRLQPSVEDGYAWSVSEEKRHLLETTLGRGTVGLYQNIIDEIGKSIEAVDPRIFQKDSTNDGHDEKRQKTKLANSSGGFTEIIQRLELENKTLVEHVHNYSIEAEKFFIKEQELQTRLSSIQTEAEAYRQTIKKLEMELDDVTNNIVEAVKILKASRNDLQKENSTERFSDTTLTNGCTS